jgi:hypothetical protein
MEIFIIIVIVGLATAYIIKTYYNKYKTAKTGGSSCGCSSCDTRAACCESEKNGGDPIWQVNKKQWIIFQLVIVY